MGTLNFHDYTEILSIKIPSDDDTTAVYDESLCWSAKSSLLMQSYGYLRLLKHRIQGLQTCNLFSKDS